MTDYNNLRSARKNDGKLHTETEVTGYYYEDHITITAWLVT